MSLTSNKKTYGAGYLIPRMLVLFCLLDLTLRLAEVGFGAFKEPRAIPHSDAPDAPFEPNVRVHLPLILGDLANIGNLRDGSESRSLQFSTDALGFRNTGTNGAVKGIVFGDSFSWSGDRDEYSFPAQLGQQLGCRIYNGAGLGFESRRPDGAHVNSVANRIGMTRGVVILTELERRSFERLRAQDPQRARQATLWSKFQEGLRRLYRTSPIKRYGADMLRSVYDDRFLPNIYADNIVRVKLKNGEIMSFYPIELRPPSQAYPFPLAYWTKLKGDLEASKRQLIVVLIPNKYTIYQRLFAEPDKWPTHSDQVLARNEAALRSLNIPVVNLAPALRALAEAGIDRHQYVFWRNDTHWNLQGVKTAAALIAQAFPKLLESCKQP